MENYKQKYNEALDRAKGMYEQGMMPERIEYIFPELKESKFEDEKIREELKFYLEVRRCHTNDDEEYISCNRFLSWLEKQAESQTYKGNADTMRKNLIKAFKSVGGNYWGGIDVRDIIRFLESKDAIELEKRCEQKPADKNQPKFKDGDFILNGDVTNKSKYEIFKILKVCSSWYDVENIYDGRQTMITFAQEDTCRLWTIQDAKDGDVLTCYSDIKGQPIEQTGIIKQYVGRHGGCSNSFKAHFGIDWDNNVVIEGYMGSSNIYPSTKEQRDLLYQKMKESGYMWDVEKKELKKIEQEQNEDEQSEKKLKEFNIDEYHKNPERKIVTRDGREVEILKIDTKRKTNVPVIAMMDGYDIRFFTTNGRLSLERETCSDLFFADDNCDTCDNDKGCVACENGENWQSFRAEAAKDILCAAFPNIKVKDSDNVQQLLKIAISKSIKVADELIKQLKEKEEMK